MEYADKKASYESLWWGAKVLPANPLLSVEETAEDAFVGYRGNSLDFRMFPELKGYSS